MLRPTAPLALLLLATLAVGPGAAGAGDLEVRAFSFTHHLGPPSGPAPVTLGTTFRLTVDNPGERIPAATAVLYVGSLSPSVGLQLRQPLGPIEPGSTTIAFVRNAVPSPYYCVALEADGTRSPAACAIGDGVTLA